MDRAALEERLDYWIPIGLTANDVLGGDGHRYFAIRRREEGAVWFRTSAGVVVRCELDGAGRIAARTILSPDAAAEFERGLLEPVSAAEALESLRSGRVTHLSSELHPGGHQDQTWQLPEGGVLTIRREADGRWGEPRVLGADAAKATVEALKRETRWQVADARPNMPLEARSWGEALLLVRCDGGDPVAARHDPRYRPPRVHVLGEGAPAGRWTFVLGDDQRLDPTWLGEGMSRSLDPADLVLFAGRVERAGRAAYPTAAAYRLDLRIAAEALRQAARFVPAGAERPPASALRTAGARRMHALAPARFERGPLLERAAALEAMARGDDSP